MHISDGVFIMSIGSEARLLAASTMRGKKKRKKNRRKADDCAWKLYEGLCRVKGLQELDFNPLKSISTLEKRDPPEKKEKVQGTRKQEGRRERGWVDANANLLLPAGVARGLK